jgi:protein-tyrosine-phosphatase/DNA-binding transcriptional ArsR family regulator
VVVPRDARDLTPHGFVQLVADPHRWQLLRELARSDRRVNELTALLGKPQNVVSYHLGELRAAGLVSAKPSAADRRDTYYRAELRRCGDLLCAAGAALQPGLQLAQVPPAAVAAGQRPRPRVLFLCTGNSARSQMAEAVLRARSGNAVDARSAGSAPKTLHPNAVRVMAERGIDISGHTVKHLRRFSRTQFDRVVTLCDRLREICPEFPGRPVTAHWSIADPALEGDSDEATYPTFVRTADELEMRVGFLLADLAAFTKEHNRERDRQRPLSRR